MIRCRKRVWGSVVAVHRRADNDVEDRTSIKRPIGPLLVTIDDLQAICDFLVEKLRPKSKVELTFLSGGRGNSKVLGTIDSSEDLQLLTRKEMQYLRVQCDDIRIDIFKRKAYCYASRMDQSAIFNAWIRHRRRYSWQAAIMDNMPDLPIRLGFISAVLYWAWGHNFFGLSDTHSIVWRILTSFVVLLGVTTIGTLLCVAVIRSGPKVVPVHLPEWNKRRQELWQHYQTTSIALLGVAIAGATFVLGRMG